VRGFGGLPRTQELAIPERHLGLATAEDHPLDDAYLGHLADWLETHLDLEGLLAAMPPLTLPEEPAPVVTPPLVRLGVARDRAFCFYYPENLELLASFGAELVPFSPLKDRELPADLHGIYLGGGYPELYAEQLAANAGLKQALQEAAAGGLPIYAECGGYLYLGREIEYEGATYPMAGVLPTRASMAGGRLRLGYVEAAAVAPHPLAGEAFRGHLFHYSSTEGSATPAYRVSRRGESFVDGCIEGNVVASYVHLHFRGSRAVARWLASGGKDVAHGTSGGEERA